MIKVQINAFYQSESTNWLTKQKITAIGRLISGHAAFGYILLELVVPLIILSLSHH